MSRAAISLKRPVEAGPVLAYLEDCRRAHRNKSRWDRFTDAYTVFLFAALGAYLAFAALREGAIGPAKAVPVIDELARWAPPVLLLLLVASLRYCTWQGPVLFSLPDVEWLLSAPLSHVGIVRRRLRRGLAVAAGLGAALGFATFVVIEAELGAPAWPLLGATVGGLVMLGSLAARRAGSSSARPNAHGSCSARARSSSRWRPRSRSRRPSRTAMSRSGLGPGDGR